MQTVGVDFGTTNVRIATWDSTQPGLLPQTQRIGQGDASTMPAVIAFQRRPRGATSTIVGEDADALADDSGRTPKGHQGRGATSTIVLARMRTP